MNGERSVRRAAAVRFAPLVGRRTMCFLRAMILLAATAIAAAGCASSPEEPEPVVMEAAPPYPEESQAVYGQGRGEAVEIVVPPDAWTFEKQAIHIRVLPSPSLNMYRNRAHTLMLGVFQLSDPNTFETMRSTTKGLHDLLGRETFDAGTGVLSAERRVIRPDQQKLIVLNRAEGAQYIGLAAGYFNLDPGKVSYVLKIPGVQDGKSGLGAVNPFADPPPPRPGRLKIWLFLDRHQIEDVRIRAE